MRTNIHHGGELSEGLRFSKGVRSQALEFLTLHSDSPSSEKLQCVAEGVCAVVVEETHCLWGLILIQDSCEPHYVVRASNLADVSCPSCKDFTFKT